jgi:hypothetical protein
MDTPITVTMKVTEEQMTLLVKDGPHERLVGRLGSPMAIHRLALMTILEGLAMWFQRRLRVVLVADSEQIESWTGLVDGYGFGLRTLHFEVEVPRPRAHLRDHRIRCDIDARDVRRMARLPEVP